MKIANLQGIFLTLFLLPLSCSDDSEEESVTSSAKVNSQKRQVVNQLLVQPPVEANTPTNFQGAFTLARMNLSDPQKIQEARKELGLLDNLAGACNSQYDSETQHTQWRGCRAAANVKENFFLGTGPTDIAKLTGAVDNRMADIFRNNDWSYMPCFDEKNTAGGEFFESEETLTYPAFAQYEWGPTITFADKTTFTMDFTTYLSCYSGISSPNDDNSWVAWGRKDGAYYIKEGSVSGTGSIAKISKNGDIELYFGVGSAKEAIPTTWDEEIAQYNMDKGVTHLKSYAETGIMEVTVANIGETKCKTHFVTNGKLMYIEINDNEIGACSPTDDGIGSSSKKNDNGNRAYVANDDNLNFCLDVSKKDAITAFDSTTPCSDAGLSNSAFSFTTLSRDTFKGFYGPLLFSTDPVSNINPVIYVSVDSENFEGTDSMTRQFAITSETGGELTTTCDSTTVSDVSLNYTLDIAEILAAEVAAIETSSSKSPDFDGSQYLEKELADLQATTGANAGSVKFALAASAGGIKWADFDLTVSLKLDGTEIASGSYVENTDHASGAKGIELAADLANISATSTLTLTGTGQLRLECTTRSATEGTATLRLGYPRLISLTTQ